MVTTLTQYTGRKQRGIVLIKFSHPGHNIKKFNLLLIQFIYYFYCYSIYCYLFIAKKLFLYFMSVSQISANIIC